MWARSNYCKVGSKSVGQLYHSRVNSDLWLKCKALPNRLSPDFLWSQILSEDFIDDLAILLKAVINQRWDELQLCLRVGLEFKIFW